MLVVHHTCTMIWSELTAGSTVLWHSPILHTDMGWKPIVYGIYWLKTHYCPLSFGGGDQTLDLHRLGQEFYHKAPSDASHLLVLNMVSTSCSGWAMNLLCSPGCQWTWGPPTSVYFHAAGIIGMRECAQLTAALYRKEESHTSLNIGISFTVH